MTPSSFETLCQLLVRSDHIPKGNAFGRRCIDPEKQITVAVWALTNEESCRQISDRFNVTMSVVALITVTVYQDCPATSQADYQQCFIFDPIQRSTNAYEDTTGRNLRRL